MKKWQRDRNKKKAAASASIQSFFKPKVAKVAADTSDGRGSQKVFPVSLSQQQGGPQKEEKSRKTRSKPLTSASTTTERITVAVGSAPSPGKPAMEVDHGSLFESEADLQAVQLSQGVGIVWRNSPAKKVHGGGRVPESQAHPRPSGEGPSSGGTEERRPLRDLILCAAKPLESTKTASAKNKSKAIEELMVASSGASREAESTSDAFSAPPGATGSHRKPSQEDGNPFARKRGPPHGPPPATQAAKVQKNSLTDKLDALRQASRRKDDSAAPKDKASKSSRNQALFDVLQKVEKVMAKKQQKKIGSRAFTPGAPAKSVSQIGNGKAQAPVPMMTFQSKEVLSTMESMAALATAQNHQDAKASASAPNKMVESASTSNQQVLECVVLEVFDHGDIGMLREYGAPASVLDLGYGDKVARVLNRSKMAEVYVKLQGSWSSADLAPGEEMNIVTLPKTSTGDDGGAGEGDVICVSEKSEEMLSVLVRHPARLVTGTKLSAATSCTRQAVLDERVQCGFGHSKASVFGSMKHEIIQRCMRANKWTSDFVGEQIDAVVRESYESMLGAEMKLEETLEELKSFTPTVQDFMATHMNLEMGDLALEPMAAKASDGAARARAGEVKGSFDIREIVDIEDYLTSTTYGVKGIVDVSVRGRVRGGANQGQVGTALMPFEIKTGREYFNHRAQVVIYVLLMEDAYRERVDQAVLWYTGKGSPTLIPVTNQERRHIVQARNYLAGALEGSQLPHNLRDQRQCSRCFRLSACMGMHKIMEGGSEETSGVGQIFSALTSHISLRHANFFRGWYRALSFEEDYGRNRGKSTEGSQEFEVALVQEVTHTLSQESRGVGFCYSFSLRQPSESPRPEAQALATIFGLGMDVGDRVRLKAENTAKPLRTSGRVHKINPQANTVDLIVSQSLRGFLGKSEARWTLSKDKGSSLIGVLKGNLMDLVMVKEKAHVQRLREVIIDKSSPKIMPLGKRATLGDLASIQSLNPRQREAVLSVLNAEDYSMILGTPGSGKSTVIVETIKLLLARGKSVLVTSHTNTAVDNILARLAEEKVDFVRVGNVKSVSPAVKPYMVGGDKHKVDTFEDYKELVLSASVLGCTCYNISHSVFMQRSFDYCIVDEASQITLPAVLGPLLRAERFVLVGDNYQLPPLVVSPRAVAAGLGKSLFVELARAHPESVIFFEEQYRMAQEISDLSSAIIYCGRLRCGGGGKGENGGSRGAAPVHGNGGPSDPQWLRDCLDLEHKKVVFVNTDGIGLDLESESGGSRTNLTEADLCIQVMRGLVASRGVSPESIGVMSVYNMQVKLLQQKARTECSAGGNGESKPSQGGLEPPGGGYFEIHTVDKFQGRDKRIILISFVRSNAQKKCGSLLLDWRRVNVALTRAKQKLILVGSASTLASAPILDAMLAKLRDRKCIVSCGQGASTK